MYHYRYRIDVKLPDMTWFDVGYFNGINTAMFNLLNTVKDNGVLNDTGLYRLVDKKMNRVIKVNNYQKMNRVIKVNNYQLK